MTVRRPLSETMAGVFDAASGYGLRMDSRLRGNDKRRDESDAFFWPDGGHSALTGHILVIPAQAGIHAFRLENRCSQFEKARPPAADGGLFPHAGLATLSGLTPP
jgi:hypothetical protein